MTIDLRRPRDGFDLSPVRRGFYQGGLVLMSAVVIVSLLLETLTTLLPRDLSIRSVEYHTEWIVDEDGVESVESYWVVAKVREPSQGLMEEDEILSINRRSAPIRGSSKEELRAFSSATRGLETASIVVRRQIAVSSSELEFLGSSKERRWSEGRGEFTLEITLHTIFVDDPPDWGRVRSCSRVTQ